MITLSDIHREVNIPTLLILPALSNVISPEGIKLKNNGYIPLIMWMYRNGLKRALLELDSTSITPTGKNIILIFSREVFNNRNEAELDYHSLLEHLVDSKWFVDNWTHEDNIYIRMGIPKVFRDDVNLIIDSKYTKVSNRFIMMSKTKMPQVPKWTDNKGAYIASKNFAAAVFKQHHTLRKITEETFGVRVPEGVDLVRKFDFELDCFDY